MSAPLAPCVRPSGPLRPSPPGGEARPYPPHPSRDGEGLPGTLWLTPPPIPEILLDSGSSPAGGARTHWWPEERSSAQYPRTKKADATR